MSMLAAGGETHYGSRRIWPRPAAPATLDLQYRVGDPLGPAAPGTREHFLVERYTLYARHPLLGLVRGQVRHQPYPLRTAKLIRLQQTLTDAAGIVMLGPSAAGAVQRRGGRRHLAARACRKTGDPPEVGGC